MAERTLAEVFVAVRPDTSRTGQELQRDLSRVDTGKSGDAAGRKFGRAFAGGAKTLISGGLKALVGGGAVALVGGKLAKDAADRLVSAGSDLNETVSKTQQIFGKSSAAVLKFGDSSARALGTSKNDALTAAANYGNLFNNLGLTQKASAKMSTQLLRTATDLASFNNASPQEMLEGISSALAGEYDPLQRYGLAINAAAVKQEALRSGLAKTEKQITPAVQAQAAYNLILRQTGKATGDFARTQGGLANQQRIAAAQSENLKSTIGTALLPAYLSVYRVVNKDLLPTLTQLAEKDGPKVAKTFGEIAEKRGPQLVAALKQGVLGVRALIYSFQDGDVTSDGFVGKMEVLGSALRDGKLAVQAYAAAYREGDVTSDGFIGKAEQLGVTTRKAMDYLRGTAIPAVRDFFGSLRAGDTGELQTSLSSAADSGKKLLPVVQKFVDEMPSFSDLVHIGAVGLEFLADNADTLQKVMPLIVAGVVAYKAAQLAANVAQTLAVPTKVAEVVVNRQLVKSNRELIASRAGVTAATIVGTAAEGGKTAATAAATGATNAGTLASIRARAAQLGQAAAGLVVRGATVAWTGAQWLLNAALNANPIGLVIVAAALLAAGFVLLWKRSETFRNIVTGALTAVGNAGKALWEHVLRPYFKFIVDGWLTVAGGIVNGAAKAFGWVPGIGPKLKAAAAKFNTFRDQVNTALSGVHDRNVKVTAYLVGAQEHGIVNGRVVNRATGGAVFGPGSGTSDSIPAMLSNGEHVWTAREVSAAGGHAAMGRMRKAALAGQVAGYAKGGAVGFSLDPNLSGLSRFEAALAAFNERMDTAAAKLALASGFNAGLNGALSFARSQAGKPYVWGAAGPGGYDCSGFMSALVNVAQGRRPYSRRFATGSLPAGLFAAGPGAFEIGWFNGNPGHTAGTINGVNVESRGGDGVVVGPGARGSRSSLFTHRGHLKGFAAGGPVLPGDPPFDLLDRRGRSYQQGLRDALQRAKVADRGGVLEHGQAALNLSGRPEMLRSADQEDRLEAGLARLERALERLPAGVGREVGRVVTKGDRR